MRADDFVTISGQTYTVLAEHSGLVLRFTSATPVVVTLPDAIDAGFNVLWRQWGGGQITFTPVTGVQRRSYGGSTKSAGQYAEGALSMDASGEWLLSGMTA